MTKLNKKEVTTILAALRHLQNTRETALENFRDYEEVESLVDRDDDTSLEDLLLTEEEIDELCEKINYEDCLL